MKQKLIVKYISIIFILATFMGSFHYHNDIQEHTDCQICTVQHNVSDIDTPADVNYLTLLSIKSESILTCLDTFSIQKRFFHFSARAPPFYTT